MEIINGLSFIFLVIAFAFACLFPFFVPFMKTERQFKEILIILLWLILITLLAIAGAIITY